MSKFREVWEYRTITEVLLSLRKEKIDEETRHLAIGAGIVLGSKKAYQKQPHYFANQIRDQAEEAGLIAQEIETLANGKVMKERLEEIAALAETERVKNSWRRPFYIMKENQPYEAESLRRMGEHLEKRFSSPGNRRRFRQFREELRRKQPGNLAYQVLKGNRLLEERFQIVRYLTELFGERLY